MNSRCQGRRRRWAPWVAGFLLSSAEARAQAPESPVEPPVVVAPAPPTPSPPVAEAPKRPLSWAGTTFDWETDLSARILGIGPDYIGVENEHASMMWSLSPSFFVFWRPRHQLSLGTRLSVAVELTNSDTTTTRHEPQIGDIPLGLAYAATVFTSGHGPTIGGVRAMHDPTLLGEGDWRTWALISSYLVLPASAESRGAGINLGTSIGAGIRQQFKLLGGDSRWLSYLLITASERWTHAFTGATSPRGTGPRSTLGGPYEPGSVARPNTLRHSLFLTLPIYRDLQLDMTLALRQGFPASLGSGGSACVQTVTGCVAPSTAPVTVVHTSTVFAVGFSYAIIPELGVAFSYVNDASQLAADGTKRGIFYSPNAELDTSFTFSFDRLYQRIVAPAPAGPPI